MFEGFVRQLILGYLGRYVKDIQKEQLKITLWNEEVLLENVELSLEAFDYLQLPFALKQGRVGKLSIKIPWKKLGWDPIVIILEDVFVRASRRDDQEWSAEAVEKREFSGKKAKLAAAELAKLSKRVCDNRAGRLFTSYISAKILDSIQVSMRNLDVVYHDMQGDSVHTMFGLKFSSLTIMKQNLLGSLSAKTKGGQVNKTLEITGLELYCSTYQGHLNVLGVDNAKSYRTNGDSVLAPCDVCVSLLINRSGEYDKNNPQHFINTKISSLEVSLDEVQLHQLLILWDYLCTAHLREKYGRYRPWCSPLSKKLDGWKKLWLLYALESVLSDVRKKLKKTSWRYFGERLSYRRKYVNLYKAKLHSLQQDQPIDGNVLSELEKMEKELDIEDILKYRSTAECRLQETLLNTSSVGINEVKQSLIRSSSVGVLLDKSRNDDNLIYKSRGWVNWLSLGMLGAGGTDDSSQFSGAVSDEVIKDIYEATEFHPMTSSDVDAAVNDDIYFYAVKFSINRISTSLRSMKHCQEIAQLVLIGSVIECKLWENSLTIITAINSGEIICPRTRNAVLLMRRAPTENKLMKSDQSSFKLQVDASPNTEVDLLIKGLLEPVVVTYDAEFFYNSMEFFGVFNSFKSQYERVLSSLNGVADANSRLHLKAEYILSRYKKVIWDISINNILINAPWENELTGHCNLVLEIASVSFVTKSVLGTLLIENAKQLRDPKKLTIDGAMRFNNQDLSDQFEVKVDDLEIMMQIPTRPEPISILKKFSPSAILISCVIPDESIPKQLEVLVNVSSLDASLSPSVYGAVLELSSHLNTIRQQHTLFASVESNRLMLPDFSYAVSANIEHIRLLVDLANDGDNSLALIFALQDIEICYALASFEKCLISLNTLNVTLSSLRGETVDNILFSSGNRVSKRTLDGNEIDKFVDGKLSAEGCFSLYYDTQSTELAFRRYNIYLNNAEVHCYPYVIRLVIEFLEKLSALDTSLDVAKSLTSVYARDRQIAPGFGFHRFGYSNYFEAGSPEDASIPLDHFPFVTISNGGTQDTPESACFYTSSDWREHFNLRDRRIGSQQFSKAQESRDGHLHTESSKCTVGKESVHLSKCSTEAATSLFDFSIFDIRLHFHDSSSIIGTITLPCSTSLVLVNKDKIDALFSVEGVILTSPWWTKSFHEYLWGPLSPDLSPIINVRVRKKENSSSSSHLEVGVGLQHIYCILPPEYLAIIIGYFSLPDWITTSNETNKGTSIGSDGAENEDLIVYKFEILDSVLILPVESIESQFLKVDIPQLYCSFINSCSSDIALKGIPQEYCVSAHKLAKRSDCLNISGRDIVISFLLCNGDAYDVSRLEKDAMDLIAPLSADIWLRFPCVNEFSPESTMSTCIMARLVECQIITVDCHISFGVEALLDVLHQFSLVPELSQCFKSDVLQFLQLKRGFQENIHASSVATSTVLTEVRCHADSLSIKLNHSGKSSMVIMQFRLSAFLENDCLSNLDLTLSSLDILSLPNSISLARFTSPSSTSPVLYFSLLQGTGGRVELFISFPSLHIWVHLTEWFEIIDTLESYANVLSKSSPVDSSTMSSILEKVDTQDDTVNIVSHCSCSPSSESTSSENLRKEKGILSVKLENMCITFHIPMHSSGSICGTADRLDSSSIVSSDLMEGSDLKYVIVAIQSKASELIIDGKKSRFKTKMEKWNGTIEVYEEKNVLSWPFFQIFHVFIEAEIDMMEQACIKAEIRLDHLKVWLSHHFFYFCRGVTYIIPETGPSQFLFGGVDIEVKTRKVSFLLSDGRWSCSGPLFELLVRNTILHVNMTENYMQSLISGHVQVSYNNIHKVFWEPFIEPWQFEISMTRKQELSLSSSIVTDINLISTAQLNLDFTEPLIECALRAIEMVKDSLGITQPSNTHETQEFFNSPWKHMSAGRYAPFVLQNLTSVPIVYHVYKGTLDEFDLSELIGGHSVEPSASVPLHVNDTPEEQLFDVWPAHSSDRLNEENLSNVAHHFISIQLDGISMPSTPISMDRVGLTYLEVDFSKSDSNDGGEGILNNGNGFVVPVVFDVSVQRYSKLIRLYSTVILSNATSFPLELRFDIPFGVAPMILDPIYPGQEFPLPLHLAEAGRIRWRPIGNSYLWSEVYNLANLLLQETKVGFLKSFVCYPAHPNDDPFRCCLSVKNISLPGYRQPKNAGSTNSPVKNCEHMSKPDESNRRLVHHLILHTPLSVKNYLPQEVSLTMESGGTTHTAFLTEVETFFHNVDPMHDLGLEIHMQGYKSATLTFPRAETFCTLAKFNGTKFSLSENITFDPYSNGSICITVEKMMDAVSGVRELSIYVPYLLYNCIGFPLAISEPGNGINSVSCIIHSSYNLSEHELCQPVDGLSMASSFLDSEATDLNRIRSSSSVHVFSKRDSRTQSKILISEINKDRNDRQLNKIHLETETYSVGISKKRSSSSSGELNSKNSHFTGCGQEKGGPCMFSPVSVSSDDELSITVSRAQSENDKRNTSNLLWSIPFFVPPSGSSTVLVPQSSPNSAYMISVTSSAVSGPFTGRSSAIIFQPRYVISNACSKDVCYKQKGTNQVFRLCIGEHSHLHWMDVTRELLVSIRYDEPGWQWSGSFLPYDLGDTQVKMQNYVMGSSSIIRVEVQNADISVQDEKVVGSLRGNSGTILILLSDDDTGYMPYRIDNFSKEKLRIFQQKCETFETLIHPYTSCPYAWDEPCYPHRLTMEVPGERILGSYSLDDVKVYMPIDLPLSLEKPERKLVLSVHAEGATKVLSVIDSNNHILEDMEKSNVPHMRETKKHEIKQEKFFHFKEKISIVIPYLGISLINIHSQELAFICARNMTVHLLQSLDQQKISFKISSLQIDNQLRSSPYPVMLCFDNECKSNQTDKILHRSQDVTSEPAVYIGVSKWRKKDLSLVSFEYISLRVADFHLELEHEVILSLFDFIKNVTSRFHGGVIQLSAPLAFMSDSALVESSSQSLASGYHQKSRGNNNNLMNASVENGSYKHYKSLLSVVPIGAPWQQIYLLARRHKKIYVEAFEISPINLTLSFSSAPWILRNGVLTSRESLIHRGLMALADVEGAQVHLKQLTIAHHISSWESIQEILARHLSRQLLHEMYKVFGSAGVIGNPMGFARTLGLGLRDFLSVPARTIFESPTGLITGMAQGTTSLLSNTVYAISDAATQFSKAAHKGIVAFTFDDHAVSRMERQQLGGASHSKGVINEVLEGLTGLLQLPIEGAEKHGLPGVLSGIALGVTGLVAKPAASILQVTGETAQSIRNRSKIYQMRRKSYRVRLPRPLSRESPLRPYSWEEAIGNSVLFKAGDGLRLKDEIFVTCKALKQAGKFVVITERLIITVSCSSLADLGKPEFRGVPADLEWVIEAEIGLESVMHADTDQGVIHIVGSTSDNLLRRNQQTKGKAVRWNSPTIPLVQTNLELVQTQDAENLLQILLSTIERGKDQGWGFRHLVRRSSIDRACG